MNWMRSVLLVALCGLCWVAPSRSSLARQKVGTDWKVELAKAKAGIEKNPKSAFWHNQAGVAYNAMGDFESAVKEIKLATALDPSDPINYSALYAIYKNKGMRPEQRQVLLDRLEKDANNPLAHFEFGYVLEEEKYWADSLREYQTAKCLAAGVKGPTYTDSRGNVYGVDGIGARADSAIDKVAKLSKSAASK
jgi:tetratricopeptide (TPR) repeat protein